MHFVLDASIALSWCFSDEGTPKTINLLEKLETGSAMVPSIWFLEISNILVMAEKRKRISYGKIMEFFSLIEVLDIQVDSYSVDMSYKAIFSIAHKENLTSYDAAYVELAVRNGLPLAGKDIALLKAAKKQGVKIISC